MSTFTGTRALAQVSIRQDARSIAPWIGLITVLSASSILAYAWIFPDPQDRAALAASLGGNPALSLIFGPARDLMTPEGFNAWRAGGLGTLFAGLMSILIVVRNSRAAEDSGQAELLASGVMGRQTRLATALILAAGASIVLGVVSFLVTIACGAEVTSTLMLCATFTFSGLMFGGVAAVTVQIGSDARTASSMAIATLGVLYILRGYFESSGAPSWTNWLTPFGWLSEVRPASGNNPWPLLACLALAVILVVAAFALQNRRDFGQGLVTPKPGPARAGLASNVWGLALRLHRSSLIAWVIAFAGLGFVFGDLSTSIGDVIASNPAMAEILAAGETGTAAVTFAFVATILQITGIIASIVGVQIALRIYAEEIDYRVEPLLAGSLRRPVYFASNVVIAVGATFVGLFVAGLTLGLVASPADVGISVGDAIGQAVATTPAIWVLTALAFAVVGAAPAVRIVAWLGVVATFGITLLGPTFKLPDWALDISPLRHVPNVMAPSPDWSGLVWLTAIAAGLLAVGFIGFRRRDVL